MGLLLDDKVLDWEKTQKHTAFIKSNAISQFLRIWDIERDRHDDPPLWGDEIEYFLIYLDEREKNAKLALRQEEAQTALNEACPESNPKVPSFAGEFTRYMVESNPGTPFNASLASLLTVEKDMRQRRDLIWKQLHQHEAVVTLSSFPRLGADNYTHPPSDPSNADLSRSLIISDDVIGAHGRYEALAVNIRERRGSKPTVNVPIFIDKCTPRPFVDPIIHRHRREFPEDEEIRNGPSCVDCIYLDTPLFGQGGCALQVNIQLKDMHEARRIHDALLPMTPIMLALTASSPVWRGYISDVDGRTYAATRSVDDRKPDELSKIRKSRCDIGDMYIWTDPRNKPEYSDIPISWNEDAYTRLKAHGIDEQLCQFYATLFLRDPLLVFENNLEPTGPDDVLHFENINSSVWQTMRLKPAIPKSKMGWRVEFRSMEASITDFESCAYSVFIVLLSQAILHFDLNLYIPMSKVEENMKVGESRDAARQGRFHFRKHIFSSAEGQPAVSITNEYQLMTVDEIFNGYKDCDGYPGLVKIVRDYVMQCSDDGSVKSDVLKYVDFISEKASGALPTTAAWIRDFIRSHPTYKFDSVVSQEANYDLMKTITGLERGSIEIPELLPAKYRAQR